MPLILAFQQLEAYWVTRKGNILAPIFGGSSLGIYVWQSGNSLGQQLKEFMNVLSRHSSNELLAIFGKACFLSQEGC
jgi:hypothetical protein